MGRTQRTKRDPAQPTTNERTNERASGRTTTSALLSTFPTQSNPFFSVFGKKKHSTSPRTSEGQSNIMVEHSKNDSRGHGSGKCDLRGELKKCEGKSIKDLAV